MPEFTTKIHQIRFPTNPLAVFKMGPTSKGGRAEGKKTEEGMRDGTDKRQGRGWTCGREVKWKLSSPPLQSFFDH